MLFLSTVMNEVVRECLRRLLPLLVRNVHLDDTDIIERLLSDLVITHSDTENYVHTPQTTQQMQVVNFWSIFLVCQFCVSFWCVNFVCHFGVSFWCVTLVWLCGRNEVSFEECGASLNWLPHQPHLTSIHKK